MSEKQKPHPRPKTKPSSGANQPQGQFNGKNAPRPGKKPAPANPANFQPKVIQATSPIIDLPTPIDPDYVVIAKIVAPFGLRGAVKATIRTDFPERFDDLEEAWLAPAEAPFDAGRTLYKVLEARPQNEKQVMLKFEGVTKPEQAEALRGYTVAVPRSEAVPLQEGEYYIFQLVGLDVYTEEDEFVGRVIDVLEYPANDVYEVRGPMSPKPVLIPAIKDVVKEIDLEKRRITIELMDGLI